MKVYIQIVDTKTNVSQFGMIDEPVEKGFEVANALGHFGININNMEWFYDVTHEDLNLEPKVLVGNVRETSKIINIIVTK